MPKATRNVDVSVNGVTAQVPLIVDKNAQNEEAMGRALVHNGELVSATNPLPINFPTLPAGTNAIGTVTVGNFPATQPVSIATLPTLPAGTNAIGAVDLRANGALVATANPLPISLATLPAGTNAIGTVTVGNFPATQPVSIATLPALPTGANVIGAVELRTNGAVVANANPLPTVVAPTSFYSNYSTATRAGTSVLKSGNGRLLGVDADGTALTAPFYLQFFDTTTVPAAGVRCRRYFPVLPDTVLFLDNLVMDFTTGIVVVASATRDTYTVVSDLTNVYFSIIYR